jgi:general secretion pathway protein B
MSYILDALRRADSERERGTIPGIHAQPVPLLPDEEPAPARVAPWVWGASALGVIVVLIGAFVWALMRPDPAAGRGVAQAAPSLPAPALPAPTLPAPPIPAAPSLAAPGPARVEPPLPAPAVPKPKVVPPLAAAASAPAAAARRAPAAGSAARVATDRAAASSAGPAVPAEAPRIYAQNELPEEIRRSVSALVVNGSVFAKNAADRFLIINGQIVHEKDTVAPDVVLEQIKQRAAVLQTKGYRFEITY